MMRALKAIARRGNRTARAICGCLELYGWSYPSFFQRAEPWLSLAASEGTASEDGPLWCFMLAYCIAMDEHRTEEALGLATKAATDGLPEAATFVGLLVEQMGGNIATSAYWFETGGRLGDPWGHYHLGLRAANSKSDAERRTAKAWFQKAASEKHLGAMAELGRLYAFEVSTEADGLRLTRAAAAGGNVFAMIDLANYHRMGLHGLLVDERIAEQFEKEAMDRMEDWTKECAF